MSTQSKSTRPRATVQCRMRNHTSSSATARVSCFTFLWSTTCPTAKAAFLRNLERSRCHEWGFREAAQWGLPLLVGPLSSLDSSTSLQDLGAMAGDPAATTRKDSTNTVEQAEQKNGRQTTLPTCTLWQKTHSRFAHLPPGASALGWSLTNNTGKPKHPFRLHCHFLGGQNS